jgi:CheY-like chemotaxis protein
MPADILLVDDQRDITRFLRHALESLGRGLRVVESLSAEEALLELRGGGVQVLVTDLRLPGMDGLALLNRARKVSPATRAVMISGQADGDQRRAAEQFGAEAILDKPIELSEFLATVTRLLETRRPVAQEAAPIAPLAGGAPSAPPPAATTPPTPEPLPAVALPLAPTPERALLALCVALGATGGWLVETTGEIKVTAGEVVSTVTEQRAALVDVVRAGRMALEALQQPAGEHWHELASNHGALWLSELAPGLVLIALGPLGAERGRDQAQLDATRTELLALLAAANAPSHAPSITLQVPALGTAELRALDDALAALDRHDAHAFWE